jgi:hypothetical protein
LVLASMVILCGCQDRIDHAVTLRSRLESAHVEQRRAAVDELQQLGLLSDENLALAENALGDTDPLVRQNAARVLIAQAAERPELAERLVAWARATVDPQCREWLQDAVIGKTPPAIE